MMNKIPTDQDELHPNSHCVLCVCGLIAKIYTISEADF